jgi:hypothetical protein
VVVLRCARVFFCGHGREKSLSACLALTRSRLLVAPFLLGAHRGHPMSTILYIPEETLGSVRSEQQWRVDGVSLLEVVGMRAFGVLGAWWAIEGWCSGCVAYFCYFPNISSLHYCLLFFCLGILVLLPQHFLGFKLLYRCGCYIYIARRKPVSRNMISITE